MSLVSIASLSLAGIVAIDFQQALPMVGTITEVAYIHAFKREGADPVIYVLDGRGIFHRITCNINASSSLIGFWHQSNYHE